MERESYDIDFRSIWLSAIFILGLFFLAYLSRDTKTIKTETRDTTYIERIDTIMDTITYIRPQYTTEVVLIQKRDSVMVKKNDTVFEKEEAIIPITQKVYKDSTYTAYVSGYSPNLDSIHIYRKNLYTTYRHDYTVTIKEKDKKWSFGPAVGVGVGKNGITPYVGIGLQYRLFAF